MLKECDYVRLISSVYGMSKTEKYALNWISQNKDWVQFVGYPDRLIMAHHVQPWEDAKNAD